MLFFGALTPLMNFYKPMRLSLFLGFFLTVFTSSIIHAQNATVSGAVYDASSGQPLVGAKIQVKNEPLVVLSDTTGKFRFFIQAKAGTLIVSSEGYTTKEVSTTLDGAEVSIELRPFNISLRQTVIMPSRKIEPIEKSPVQVEKVSQLEIQTSPTSDFYQGIGELAGVNVATSSVFLKTINLNGFADTRQIRLKQFIEGVDNEAPGFNSPLGNMNGASDLDLQSVEVAPAPVSAMYGSGAMQGVVAMNTKSPYDYKGIAVQLLDGGTTASGSYFDAQVRYANTFGKQNRLAIKITAQFTQLTEWPTANDSLTNYGSTKSETNLNAYVQNEAAATYCPTCPITTDRHNYYVAANNFLTANPEANNFDPTNPHNGYINVQAPGYAQNSLTNNSPQNGKVFGGIYYRFNNQIEFSGTYRASYGSAIYQTLDPYQLKSFFFQQPTIQIKGRNFFVRLYGSFENSEQSYNLRTAGNALTGLAQPAYISKFSDAYFNTIDTLVGGIANCAGCISSNPWIIDSARNVARRSAQGEWYTPGSQTFKDSFNSITKSAARFYDRSALVHLDAQYNWDFVKWLDVITGASYRIYIPNSAGTYLQDTGSATIREVDINAFLQITKRLFHDRFIITAALNVDDNSNFKPQLSPRGALIYTARSKGSSHTFRLSASTGFRNPSIQEQYLFLNTGSAEQLGNLYGMKNIYTLTSVNNALSIYNNAPTDTNAIKNVQQALTPITLAALKPEVVTSFEFDYRAEIKSRILIDLSAHYNLYNDLIGLARVVAPNGNGTTNGNTADSTGANNIIAGNYTPIQTWANTGGQISAWGGSISLACYTAHGITPYANYTYTDVSEKNVAANSSIMLPGFNTPRHKLNIGVNGNHVAGGFGFNINWKWQTAYQWDGWFASGTVPSYHALDAQIYYQFDKAHSTIRLGGSNIYNKVHIEAPGAPQIGAIYYAGWLFDFTKMGTRQTTSRWLK